MNRRRLLPVLCAAILFSSLARAGEAPPKDRMPRVEGARELYVAPDGRAGASGAPGAPLDLVSVFTKPGLVKPGDIVWIRGGLYKPGRNYIYQTEAVCGTKERPIIFRAVPGERATVEAEIFVRGSYTWLWGLEITGEHHVGANVTNGDGVKLINLVLHDNSERLKPDEPPRPLGHGLGGWDAGNDHEYYGNIIYHNGSGFLDHGIYSNNTAAHTVKRYVDNIVFNNAGFGFHVYDEKPALSGFRLEGNISFASQRGANILTGGLKPISDLVLRDNCAYFPAEPPKEYKRYRYNVWVGYRANGCRDIRIENNHFMGGPVALRVNGMDSDVIVRNNTFWGTEEEVEATWAPDAKKTGVTWDENTYVADGKFDFDAWKRNTGFDARSKLDAGRDGRPSGLFVFKRVNQYEPERVHLAVFNWDHEPVVKLDVSDLAGPGVKYRIVNVLDFFGKPVAAGEVAGKTVDLPMRGHDLEPEFGAYVLFRDLSGAPVRSEPLKGAAVDGLKPRMNSAAAQRRAAGQAP